VFEVDHTTESHGDSSEPAESTATADQQQEQHQQQQEQQLLHQQQQQQELELELQCPVSQDTAVPCVDKAKHRTAAVEIAHSTPLAGDHGSNPGPSDFPQLISAVSTAAPVDVTTLRSIGADSSSNFDVGLRLPSLSSTEGGHTDTIQELNHQRSSLEGETTQNGQAAHNAQGYTQAEGNTQQQGNAGTTRPQQLIRDDSIGPFAQAALLPFGSMDSRGPFGSWTRQHDGSPGSHSESLLRVSKRHAHGLLGRGPVQVSMRHTSGLLLLQNICSAGKARDMLLFLLPLCLQERSGYLLPLQLFQQHRGLVREAT
jgi:hypothetical protein